MAKKSSSTGLGGIKNIYLAGVSAGTTYTVTDNIVANNLVQNMIVGFQQ